MSKHLVHLLFVTIISCMPLLAFAQKMNAVADTTNVQSSEKQFTIGLNIKHSQYKARFHANGDDLKVGLSNYLIGTRLRYKNLSLVLGFSVFKDKYKGYTQPKFYSAGLKYYSNNFLFTGHGSYASLVNGWSQILNKPIRNIEGDSKICHTNLYAAYLFNEDRINVKGFFNFTGQQEKHAGSWLISAFYDLNYWDLHQEDIIAFQDESFDYNFLRRSRYGVGAGYMQSLVFSNLSFMAMINIGAEYVTIDHDRQNKGREYSALVVNPTLKLLGFATYNFQNKYIGFTSEYFPDLSVDAEVYSQVEYWTLRLSTGIHF